MILVTTCDPTRKGGMEWSTRAARASWGIVALRWVLRPSNSGLWCGRRNKEARQREESPGSREGGGAGEIQETRYYRVYKRKKESGAQQKQRHPLRVTLPDLNSLSSMPTNARILTQEVPHRLLFVSRWSHATVWAELWSLDFFSHTQSYS